MSQRKQEPFTVFIEGNVGSGKTSLLNYLEKYEDILVLKEDVDVWTNFHGFNLLELKFSDPEHFQFPFQSMATLSRLRQHLKDTEKPIKVMERSLISGQKCFLAAQRELNLLHEGMYYVLEEWYDYIDQYHDIKSDLIVYIKTLPEVAFNRIKERGRKEEEKISLEYLKKIHNLHEKVFIKEADQLQADLLVIDGNVSESDLLAEYKKIEAKIFDQK